MTFDEMVKIVLKTFPNAVFGEDKNGEVLISTGFTLSNNMLVPLEEE